MTNVLIDSINRNRDINSVNYAIKNWSNISPNPNTAFNMIAESVSELVKNGHVKSRDLNGIFSLLESSIIKNKDFILESVDPYRISDEDSEVIEDYNNRLDHVQIDIDKDRRKMTMQKNYKRMIMTCDLEQKAKDLKFLNSERYAKDGIFNICDEVFKRYDLSDLKKTGACLESMLFIMKEAPIEKSEIAKTVVEYCLVSGVDISIIESVLNGAKLYDKEELLPAHALIDYYHTDVSDDSIIMNLYDRGYTSFKEMLMKEALPSKLCFEIQNINDEDLVKVLSIILRLIISMGNSHRGINISPIDNTILAIKERVSKTSDYTIKRILHSQIKHFSEIDSRLSRMMKDAVMDIEDALSLVNESYILESRFRIAEKLSDVSKKMMTGIRKVNPRDIQKFGKSITRMIYKVPNDSILEEVPNINDGIRRVILYSSVAAIPTVGILLVIPIIIVDTMFAQNATIKQVDILIKQLEEEKSLIESRMKQEKDRDRKKEIEKYIDTLEIQIDRARAYREAKLSDMNIYESTEDEVDYAMGTILMMESIVEGTCEQRIINEVQVSKRLLLAKEKIQKAGDKLSAKDKSISRVIDSSIDKFIDGMKRMSAVENRERIIEGKMLPTASKIIKLAIAGAVGWQIQPAIAVVVALTSIAMGKGVRDREKQLVLDELTVKLDITERKIRQAEMNNDLDAVEKLMELEMVLKREKQRIQYGKRINR